MGASYIVIRRICQINYANMLKTLETIFPGIPEMFDSLKAVDRPILRLCIKTSLFYNVKRFHLYWTRWVPQNRNFIFERKGELVFITPDYFLTFKKQLKGFR